MSHAPGPPVVLLGDSITLDGDWAALLPGVPVRNAGVGGDTTASALDRVGAAVTGRPSRVFVLIGTNDVGAGEPEEAVLTRYERLLSRVAAAAPDADVVVQSVLPREAAYGPALLRLNAGLRELTERRGLAYLDLWPAFLGEDSGIRPELTDDGLHLSAPGYRLWADALRQRLAASP